MPPAEAQDVGFETALALAREDDDKNKSLLYLKPSSYQSLLVRLQSEICFGLDLDLGNSDSDSDSDSEPEYDADTDPESLLDKLRIEYDPINGLLSFKMPESRIHSAFAAQVSHSITAATCPFLPVFQALGAPNITLMPGSSTNNKIRGNRYPDISWGRLCLETNPPVVAKVAYTDPTKLSRLQRRCEGFLKGTHGLRQVRTVIAFNIYNPTAPSNLVAIMHHLNQCSVGV
ncbi:hypothetical protein CDEST_15204 [Colletotrichum destructivum]|uniref:Uncharacterized protein n=1 Tax=Colletotrichum destructivum TaxID=34406 RepID=A0AAX4J3Y6_9PEZI|nr:hypothetical protein CDEST_15204 [Colletotrichum destructivum]